MFFVCFWKWKIWLINWHIIISSSCIFIKTRFSFFARSQQLRQSFAALLSIIIFIENYLKTFSQWIRWARHIKVRVFDDIYILMAAKEKEKKLVDFVYSDLHLIFIINFITFFFDQKRAKRVLYLNFLNKYEGIRWRKTEKKHRELNTFERFISLIAISFSKSPTKTVSFE